jgi:hypothetical protein
MANRIWAIVHAGSRAIWPRVTAATLPHCFVPVVFSRAFSASAAAPAAQADCVDMSSTVKEMREFAYLHGISLKGLRLKSDVFAAIQMHFGVFVNVHAGAHSEGSKLQENIMVDDAPSAEEDGDVLLKVRLPFAVLKPAPTLISAHSYCVHSLFGRLSIKSSLKNLLHLMISLHSGALCR